MADVIHSAFARSAARHHDRSAVLTHPMSECGPSEVEYAAWQRIPCGPLADALTMTVNAVGDMCGNRGSKWVRPRDHLSLVALCGAHTVDTEFSSLLRSLRNRSGEYAPAFPDYHGNSSSVSRSIAALMSCFRTWLLVHASGTVRVAPIASLTPGGAIACCLGVLHAWWLWLQTS